MARRNKEDDKKYRRAYLEANKDRIKEQRLQYRKDNKSIVADNNKRWYQNNKEKKAKYNLERQRNKVISDPSFKYIKILRARQGQVLKGRASTTAGLGCTRQELLDHLSKQFQPGMTFDNHGRGGWHIDHIIPLDSHKKDSNGDWDSESQYNKQLIHYTNLQPLWEQDNLEKSNKIISYENISSPSCGPNNRLP